MALKNKSTKQNGYICVYCDKSFNRMQIVKSNGLDVCRSCDTHLKKWEAKEMAKRGKTVNTISNKLDKAQNATETASVFVALVSATITLVKILTKK